MKKIIFHILLVLCAGCFVSASKVPTCKCDGVDLHGKVKVVSYAADFKVKIVDYGEDFTIHFVEYAPGTR